MTPTQILIAAAVLLALVAVFIVARMTANKPVPAAVAKVEAAIEGDAWKLLSRTVASIADASGKKAAVANANAELSDHFANVAKLKAMISALPDA